METKLVEVVLIDEDSHLPQYATSGSAGMDLCATCEKVVIPPHEKRVIETGIRCAVPEGYELQIRSRSGLAMRDGVVVLNSPGTIDSDYRGEIGVILMNHSDKEFVVRNGDRIAQAVLCPVIHCDWKVVTSLDSTSRGEGGFGSTGK